MWMGEHGNMGSVVLTAHPWDYCCSTMLGHLYITSNNFNCFQLKKKLYNFCAAFKIVNYFKLKMLFDILTKMAV